MAFSISKTSSRNTLKVGEIKHHQAEKKLLARSHKGRDMEIGLLSNKLLTPEMAILRKNLEPIVSRAAPSGRAQAQRRTSKHLSRSRYNLRLF